MPSTAEGCFREGETQSHLNFEPHRCLCSAASQRKASAKESWDCLTYSRLWYLSRDKHNRLWPTSAKGIGFKTYPQLGRRKFRADRPNPIFVGHLCRQYQAMFAEPCSAERCSLETCGTACRSPPGPPSLPVRVPGKLPGNAAPSGM